MAQGENYVFLILLSCRQSIWEPPGAHFLYWRQGKCLLGPKCQPPVHKNLIVAVLNGLAAKPFRHGRGWILCGQPRPRHMPYSILRWHFSGRGWLHLSQPRPIQVPSGTQCTQKHLETCTVSTEEDIGPGPSRKLVRVKQLIVN